jgi:ADP-ribose pyrophosphatase YjhB (NUDIX family)
MRVRVAGLFLKNSSVLMVKHLKNKRSYWLLPGGGIRLGESATAALKREIKEELNIDVVIGDLLFVVETLSDDGTHIIQPTFIIEVDSFDNIKVGRDRRVIAYKLFNIDEIRGITVYPDIAAEIIYFMKYKRVNERYIYKKWVE